MYYVKQIYVNNKICVAFIIEISRRNKTDRYFTLALIYPKRSKYTNNLKFLKQYIGFQIKFK